MSGLRPAARAAGPPRLRRAPALQRTGSLWLLLAAALIGVLAVHSLSAHDAAGDHRAMASAAAADHPMPGGTSAAGADGDGVAAAPSGSPAGDGHAIVAGCVLLLVVGTVLLLPNRRTSREPSVVFTRSGRWRGPPRTPVRLTLCVQRI